MYVGDADQRADLLEAAVASAGARGDELGERRARRELHGFIASVNDMHLAEYEDFGRWADAERAVTGTVDYDRLISMLVELRPLRSAPPPTT